MIILTKLNKVRIAINDDMIETIAENPDTTIHLSNGNIYIVRESTEDIIQKIVEFRRKINGIKSLME